MKRFSLFAVCFVLVSLTSRAQDNDLGWKYAKSITEQDLKDVLTIVASEQMQGRETGTEGQRRAAIYIENKFKEIGLKAPQSLNGYQQKYPLYRDSVLSESFSLAGADLVKGTDYLVLAGSARAATIKNNEIVFAGYGIDDEKYSDYKGRNVKGKVVLVLNGEPKDGDNYLISGGTRPSMWSFGANRKATAAMNHGAVAILFVDPAMQEFPNFLRNAGRSNALTFPRENEPVRPAVVYLKGAQLDNIFGTAGAKKINDAFNAKGSMAAVKLAAKKNVEISYAKKRFSVLASNVIGYIEGTDLKDEYVVFSAHYDHLGMRNGVISYGADDDGSGTTGVIEMAAAFMRAVKDGHRPRRTLVFIAVSGEEKGLWGSEYYSQHPVFPLEKTTVNLNTDMIGRLDPNRNYGDSTNYVYVIGNDKLSSDLDPISKSINDKYTKMELDFKFNDPNDPERIYYRSDHYNFAKKGVPILFYFDGIHADYHKPSDTVDKINFDVMQKRVQYTFMVGWDIANRNAMLKRDIPLPEMGR
ncbi:MAG: M28 family peptidase [Chitinophagaceae bacterium]|nr:M28 family peptidase [Chitinophagaceae bacterium]